MSRICGRGMWRLLLSPTSWRSSLHGDAVCHRQRVRIHIAVGVVDCHHLRGATRCGTDYRQLRTQLHREYQGRLYHRHGHRDVSLYHHLADAEDRADLRWHLAAIVPMFLFFVYFYYVLPNTYVKLKCTLLPAGLAGISMTVLQYGYIYRHTKCR